MATALKDVLYPGTWHLTDGRTFTCKPDELSHYQKRLNDMLAAQVPIPLYWEHQSEDNLSEDERRAHRAKFSPGRTTKIETAKGCLQAEFDVPNADDASRLPAKFVSPGIRVNWKDGTGRVWPGPSIVHFAVTPKPVQIPQKPFKVLDLSASDNSVTDTLCLSLEGYVKLDNEELDKAQEQADKPEPKDEDAEKKTEEVKTEIEKEDNTSIQTVLDALKAHDIVLPDDTTEENLLERLTSALLTSVAQQGLEMPNEAASTMQEPEQDAAMQPMGLSMEEVKRINTRLERSEARSLALERERVQGRIQRLYRRGQISKPMHDDLLARVASVNLSYGDDGQLAANELLIELKAYEKNPRLFRVNMSHEDEEDVPLPKEAGGSSKKDDEIAKTIVRENWGQTPRRIA